MPNKNIDKNNDISKGKINNIPKNIKNIIEGIKNNNLDILGLKKNIIGFFNTLEKPKDFETFIIFSEKLNKKLIEDFSEKLDGESDNFKMCFSHGVVNYLKTNNKEKIEKLENLIINKAKFKNYYLLVALEEGFLDFLDIKDKNSLINILKSSIFDYFNDVFLEIYNELKKDINKKFKGNAKEISDYKMGGLVDGRIKSYNQIKSSENIKSKFLEKIENENLKKYFTKYFTLIAQNKLSFSDFSEIQNFSLNTWEDKNSLLGLTTTEEHYLKDGVFLDPELEIFIKQEDNYLKQKNIKLAEKYFGKDYGIGNIKFYNVEPIFSSGEVSFLNILGKSFPNDPELSNKRGNFIYSVNSRLGQSILDKAQYLIESIGIKKIDVEAFGKISIEHTAFHEYGHSLFVHGHKTSLMEELKASLFHYLYLYDNFDENKDNTKFIKDFLDFSIVEIIRKVKVKDVPAYKKYVIGQKFFLYFLMKNENGEINKDGLVEFDKDFNLSYNISNKNFKEFLSLSKGLLEFIKGIYNGGDETGELEKSLLKDIDYYVNPIFDGIYNKIN